MGVNLGAASAASLPLFVLELLLPEELPELPELNQLISYLPA